DGGCTASCAPASGLVRRPIRRHEGAPTRSEAPTVVSADERIVVEADANLPRYRIDEQEALLDRGVFTVDFDERRAGDVHSGWRRLRQTREPVVSGEAAAGREELPVGGAQSGPRLVLTPIEVDVVLGEEPVDVVQVAVRHGAPLGARVFHVPERATAGSVRRDGACRR